MTSPYDTDARWGVKRDTFWNGFEVHISETCAAPAPTQPAEGAGPRRPTAQKPNLITNVATTDATVADSTMLRPIHQALQERDLLPVEHYPHSGYPSAELIVGSMETFGVALITPVLLDHSRQAKVKEGFAASDFAVDRQAQQVTCRLDSSALVDPLRPSRSPQDRGHVLQDRLRPLPLREQCTTARSGRRQISLHPGR